MFDNLIQSNPTINFNALVNALFPNGVPLSTDPDYYTVIDEIIQTLEQGELTYGDNTNY